MELSYFSSRLMDSHIQHAHVPLNVEFSSQLVLNGLKAQQRELWPTDSQGQILCPVTCIQHGRTHKYDNFILLQTTRRFSDGSLKGKKLPCNLNFIPIHLIHTHFSKQKNMLHVLRMHKLTSNRFRCLLWPSET